MAKTPKTSTKKPPAPKASRSSRCSIEINESFVRIIKSSHSGTVIKHASAALPEMPEKHNKDYIKILSQTIKKAARTAGISRGYGIPCVLVTGGPNVILRRFTWPDMPMAAIKANTLTEIASFLPEDSSAYTISHRIVRHGIKNDGIHPVVDVVVGAISTAVSSAYTKAARKAGFAPSQLDILENARGKLTEACNILIPNPALKEPEPEEDKAPAEKPETIVTTSYAVLDIGSAQINMSLFLDGVFYSNRYFSIFPKPAEPQEEPLNIDVDTLATEVTSIIDYIQYRERGSNVQCILLLGDEKRMPGLLESLKESMDIPVYPTSEWLVHNIHGKRMTVEEVLPYLDAYGAALSARTGSRLGPDLDLKPQRVAGIGTRLVLPLVITFLILGGIMAAGIYIPLMMVSALESDKRELDEKLASFTVSASDMAEVNRDISTMAAFVNEISGIYAAYPQGRHVIPVLYGLEDNNMKFNSVSVSGGEISASGRAANFYQVADNVVWLRSHAMFKNASVQNAKADRLAEENESAVIGEYADFSMSMTLQIGAGER
jgi:Tfp pilus assembly PilM family ATPase